MTFIDIGEIGCMNMPKCHCNGNCGQSGRTNLSFCIVDLVLCMSGQYRVSPPLAVIITAWHRGMLATRHCRRSTGISAHLSSRAWWSSPRIWGGMSILVIASPNSSQICSMVLQSSDLADCSILATLPCRRKSGTTRAWWGVALSYW